jgi:FHA domain-containing protein
MPTCPAGHTSASSDFCDVCGARIGASASTPQAPRALAAQSPEPAEPCPQCGAARSGRFCESCGFDFDADPAPAAEGTGPAAPAESAPPPGGPVPASGGAAPPPGEPAPASGAADPGAPASAQASRGPVTWTAVVASDRAYFDDVVAAGGPDATALTYPAYSPERRFELAGPEMRIGRRSVSQGLEPEIDLTGPPADPGVSRLHAVLIAEQGGGWAILDPGSENGTFVNGSEIATGARVPLHDGDRIHIGAWTLITISAG